MHNALVHVARKMNNQEFSRLETGKSKVALLVAGVLGLAVGAVMSIHAQEATGGTNSPGGQSVTANLDYRELNYSIISWSPQVTPRSSAFKKEPVFSGGKVIRGMLPLGGSTSDEMGFAWDRGAGKLYLDLNRNLDLTDDPAGVFSRVGGSSGGFQFYRDIHLPFKTLVGSRSMLVDLNFYDYGRLNCTAALRSLWQGKVTLQGEEWQLGLVWNPLDQRASLDSGSLLLRPWGERNKPFSLYNGTLETVPFSRKLFLGNRAYQLRCTNEVQGDLARVQMQFTEEQPKLGELKITGAFVQRVTLEGGPYLVVLDQPGSTVKVPVGQYGSSKVWLRKGGVEAYLGNGMQGGVERITISQQAPAVLTAGGPLTNSVAIAREGRKLSMNYRLVGAGGAYQLVNQDRSHPPEFTVYQGDKKIVSGKFEFG
jgi:hypothetical protein